jgi:hypothetical protein
LDIISWTALRGGSDFLPYAGMSHLNGQKVNCCTFDAQKPSDEHVHHPPDEKSAMTPRTTRAIAGNISGGVIIVTLLEYGQVIADKEGEMAIAEDAEKHKEEEPKS